MFGFQDYLRPYLPLSDTAVPVVLKVLSLAFGAVCVGLAFLADSLGTGLLQVPH